MYNTTLVAVLCSTVV